MHIRSMRFPNKIGKNLERIQISHKYYTLRLSNGQQTSVVSLTAKPWVEESINRHRVNFLIILISEKSNKTKVNMTKYTELSNFVSVISKPV